MVFVGIFAHSRLGLIRGVGGVGGGSRWRVWQPAHGCFPPRLQIWFRERVFMERPGSRQHRGHARLLGRPGGGRGRPLPGRSRRVWARGAHAAAPWSCPRQGGLQALPKLRLHGAGGDQTPWSCPRLPRVQGLLSPLCTFVRKRPPSVHNTAAKLTPRHGN